MPYKNQIRNLIFGEWLDFNVLANVKLWAARTLHQSKVMCFMKHDAAGKHSLILHQLDRQDQPQSDTRNNKTLLGPSTPAPYWAALCGDYAFTYIQPGKRDYPFSLPIITR